MDESLQLLLEKLDTLKSLGSLGLVGDLGIALALIIAIVITHFWQKKQIQTLQAYIKLFKPENLQKDIEATIFIKDNLNQATLDHYKKELEESKDKEQKALTIIEEIQKRNADLLQRLSKYEKIDPADIVPSDASLSFIEKSDGVDMTVKFKDGWQRVFKFPNGKAATALRSGPFISSDS